MKKRYLKTGLFLLIFLSLGITIGSIYHASFRALFEHYTKTEVLYQCPSSELVFAQQANLKHFTTEPPCREKSKEKGDCDARKLYWKIGYKKGKATENLDFMQAIIGKDNNVSCYYHWPDPKKPGMYSWLIVHLSPYLDQVSQPYGAFWIKKESSRFCKASADACRFRAVSEVPVEASSKTP